MVNRLNKCYGVHAKCPVCGMITAEVIRQTLRQKWLLYRCVKCNIKFQLENGWREKIRERQFYRSI